MPSKCRSGRRPLPAPARALLTVCRQRADGRLTPNRRSGSAAVRRHIQGCAVFQVDEERMQSGTLFIFIFLQVVKIVIDG